MWNLTVLDRLSDRLKGQLQDAEGEKREHLLRLLAQLEWRRQLAQDMNERQ